MATTGKHLPEIERGHTLNAAPGYFDAASVYSKNAVLERRLRAAGWTPLMFRRVADLARYVCASDDDSLRAYVDSPLGALELESHSTHERLRIGARRPASPEVKDLVRALEIALAPDVTEIHTGLRRRAWR